MDDVACRVGELVTEKAKVQEDMPAKIVADERIDAVESLMVIGYLLSVLVMKF